MYIFLLLIFFSGYSECLPQGFMFNRRNVKFKNFKNELNAKPDANC